MRIHSLVVATALLIGRAGDARAQEGKAPPPASVQPAPSPPAPPDQGTPAPPADATRSAPAAPPSSEPPAAGPPTTPQTTGEAPSATGVPPATEPAPAPAASATPGGLLDEEHPSRLRIAAWVTTAAAVALLAAGAIVGLAAQERADEISRQQLSLDADGQTARYTPTVEQRIHDLRSEGQTYNALAIGMLSAAGAAAVVSVVLFVVDRNERRRPQQASQRSGPPTAGAGGLRAEGLAARLRLLPSVSAQGAGLGAALVF